VDKLLPKTTSAMRINPTQNARCGMLFRTSVINQISWRIGETTKSQNRSSAAKINRLVKSKESSSGR
jgi:hypothetical protein